MKMINPEKSCILDVNSRRAEELKDNGWKPYAEITAPVAQKPKKKTSKK